MLASGVAWSLTSAQIAPPVMLKRNKDFGQLQNHCKWPQLGYYLLASPKIIAKRTARDATVRENLDCILSLLYQMRMMKDTKTRMQDNRIKMISVEDIELDFELNLFGR